MSEMVERVALAIKAELGRQMDARPLVDSKPGDWHASGGTIDLEKVARVAIVAMREPTDAMLDEGFENMDFDNSMSEFADKNNRVRAGAVFRAMIDAALK